MNIVHNTTPTTSNGRRNLLQLFVLLLNGGEDKTMAKYANQNTIIIMDNAEPQDHKLFINFRTRTFWRAKTNLRTGSFRAWLYFNSKKENEEFTLFYATYAEETKTHACDFYKSIKELISMGYLLKNPNGVWEFYADTQGAPNADPDAFSGSERIIVIDAGKARKGEKEPFTVIDAKAFWNAYEDLNRNAFFIWVYLCQSRIGFRLDISKAALYNLMGISSNGFFRSWVELKEKQYLSQQNNHLFYFYATKEHIC